MDPILLFTALQVAADGIVITDGEGTILWTNAGFSRMTGYSSEVAFGRNPRILKSGAHDEGFYADLWRTILSGAVWRGEMVNRRCDGTLYTEEQTITPVLNEHQEVSHFIAIKRDITTRARTEQKLNLLARTLDSVDECVSICDPEDRLLFVNRAFLRTYGYEECNLIGENVSFIRSPLNSAEVTAGILPGTLAGGWQGELWNRKRDGTDFLILLSAAAVMDKYGNLEATVGVARDITERKRGEAELMRAREHAESATRAKSEFLSNMSHEIRTPLNGVIGMSGLLLDTELTAQQREYADIVRRSGEALLALINDILDFSKIEAGKLEIESYPFDLCEAVEDVNEMLASKAREKNIGLSLDYPPQTPRRFSGDGSRVRQIVTNLVGNAIKFTSNGSVLISVQCEAKQGEQAQMRISVSDSGVGIGPENIGRLFEKFTQVDASTTRNFGGTGLGLAISKQLVNLMGGSIGVESQPGEGSTFWFKLPLQVDTQAGPVDRPLADLHGVHALIVDDNDVTRHVLQEQIAGWGMRHGSAAGGVEALAAMRAEKTRGDPFQFLFLDQQMPEMDGIMLARTIHNDPSLRGTPIVMLTSLGQSPETQQMQGKIIDACLTKPVRQSQLFDTVVNVWAKHQGTGVSARIPTGPASPRGKLVIGPMFTSCRMRVMVAEDNIVNQKVACRMVEQLGLRADVAGNGLEAVEMSQLAPYDLILMDCQMPEMDGYEATREIRRKEGINRRTVIIAMTAEAMTGAREKCIEAGMDAYIAKPVRLADLGEALRSWLPQKRN
jgi:two-component system sensor histidine kinase/response regulator